MPLYAVTCVDKPGMAEVRASIRQTHLDYLAANMDNVVLGGVTFAADDAKDGSVWIVNLPSLAAAEAFVAAEPFVKAGVFQSVRLRRMNKGQWNPQAADGAEGI
jgi:uncharacterized protein YciI